MNISIPEDVIHIINTLEANGCKAYCVGGAVRDSVMGAEPEDWDITTSALPHRIKEIFRDYRTVDTGLQHGTVTLIINHKPYEITTFRIDGEYTDNRRPDEVSFTGDVGEDLSRRDFTVNALAYNPESGFIDLFNGLEHIQKKIIKTVGNPDLRFKEDGLRIMRGLRFSSVLGFEIDKETADSIHRNKDLLKNIAVERLSVELTKLLCGKNVFNVLMEFSDVLAVVIPEIESAVGFSQYGKKHAYDVWEHICHTVDTIPADRILRLTMLLHDLGKIPTHKLDEKGNSTFKNHAAVGGDIARDILTRLRFDKKTINAVSHLVANHDFEPPETKLLLKKKLKHLTPSDVRTLLIIKKSDRGALSPEYRDIEEPTRQCLVWLQEIEDNNECCRISQLRVNGNDIVKAGLSGERVGEALEKLLDAVIEERVANKKSDLLTYIL